MTGAERLAALAALFAPDRAAELAARLEPPEGGPARTRVLELLAATRAARLEALASALAGPSAAARRALAASLAAFERPRVARGLRAVAAGGGGGLVPAFARLIEERLSR
ncbi:MAG TPA: hypothetical protein VH880_14345 [Anaeromyxobacteraceae bacterium]